MDFCGEPRTTRFSFGPGPLQHSSLSHQPMKKVPHHFRLQKGFMMAEAIIGLVILGVFLVSFIVCYGKMNKSRVQNIMRNKALNMTSSLLQDIRSKPWDEA